MEADVAAILERSGAPKVEPEHLSRIAALLQKIPSLIEDRVWFEDKLQKGTAYDRAQEAINELRRVLPKIIDYESSLGAFEDHAAVANADLLKRWLADLPDFMNMPGATWRKQYSKKAVYSSRWLWQGHAVLLFHEYAVATGHRSISRDGPATRFIKGCFDLIGVYKATTLDAIEKAIRKAGSTPNFS